MDVVEPRSRLGALRMLFGRRDDVRRELDELGITRSVLANVPVVILVGLLLLAAGGASAAVAAGKMTTELAVPLGATGVTVAGLLVAVLQWRLGLAEKAFDALYQRIALANQMRLQVFEDLETDDESSVAEERPERYRFFVYTEIDSLEYAVRRYAFGLGMTADITERAVGHFRSRCRSAQFRTTALECVQEGTVHEGAYFSATKRIVRAIAAEEAARAGSRTAGSGPARA